MLERPLGASAVVLAANLAFAAPASAADDLAGAASAIEAACAGYQAQTPIEQSQLAEAVLTTAGVLPSRLAQVLAAENGRPEGYRPSAQDLADGALRLVVEPEPLGDAVADRVETLLAILSDHLTQPGGTLTGKLVVVGAEPEGSIFGPNIRFICPGKTPLAEIAGSIAPPDERSSGAKLGSHRLVVRQKVEDFAVAAKEASGSFQGSYGRQRTTDLDGARTTTETIAIRGAAGVRLAGDGDLSYLYGYADYALNRVRKRTSPVPTPGAQDGRAKDVDVLELGLAGSAPIRGNGFILRLSGRAGAILDFEKGARRIVGGVRLEPTGIGSIGPATSALCNYGAYSDNFLGLPIEARCSAALRAEFSEVLRAGSSTLTDADELVAVGGDITWEFRPRLLTDGKPKDGLVGGITYRYQRMISGNAPDIDRLDANLKYRWWLSDLAFDLGVTYSDGTEPKSLVDENKLTATIGIIF